MAQTVNVKSDGSFEVGFGNSAINGTTSDEFLPAQILVKMRAIYDTITAAGISELHIEKDSFKAFEHARIAADTMSYDFGTNVTEEEFESIMALSEMFD